MKNWVKFFGDAKNSGVYSINETTFADITQAAVQAGLAILCLDLARVKDKVGFLTEVAKILQFPNYFGSNWDAFEDCLTDLSWLETKAHVLLIKGSEQFRLNAPTDAATACTVLKAAGAYWQNRDIPFFVICGIGG